MNQKDFSKAVKEFIHKVPVVLDHQQTVEQALAVLRHHKSNEKIVYFYVVDEKQRLQGVVSTRALLFAQLKQSLQDVMSPSVVHLSDNHTLQEAMEVFSHHQLLALPVLDKSQKLIGVLDVQLYLEESLDVIKTSRNQEVFQILGLNLEEEKQHSPWKSYRIRMPWIFCNMLGGLACAVISRVYELVIAEVLILAMFIPLVLTVSESISMQSMTQSIQLLRKSKVSWKRVVPRIFSEFKIVSLLSITCGLVVGALSLFWGEGKLASVTIALGLTCSISLSACIGSLIPLLLHSRKLDPKIAAGPVVLMCTDVITTSIYLSLATFFLL